MSDNITQQLAALRDKISSIHEDSDFPRMTEKQYQEFSAAVDEFETGYVDYDTLNLVMGSYTALDDGYYGDHDDKQNYEYNDLVLEFEKLVEKAAKMQGQEMPTDFGDEGIEIPDDIQRELETVKAKMKAVFKDPNQMRLQFDSKNNETVDTGDAELAELKASLQRFK